MAKASRFQPPQDDSAEENWRDGRSLVWGEPLLRSLFHAATITNSERGAYVPTWISVAADGTIGCNLSREAEPAEWAYAIAHGLLHLGFGHLWT